MDPDLQLQILQITDPPIMDYGSQVKILFLGSFKIVTNWTENKISTQLIDVIKAVPLAIDMALLITPIPYPLNSSYINV